MDCKQRIIGRSVEGRSIVAYDLSEKGRRPTRTPCIVLFGGFHGDEPKSVRLVQNLRDLLFENVSGLTQGSKQKNAKGKADSPFHHFTTSPDSARWLLVPCVNPDGLHRRTRRNARKVDLNRNFPTQNWQLGNPRSRMFGGPSPASEPETRAVIRLLESCRPAIIVTVHSINRNRFCNNYDGPGRAAAQKLSRHNRYPVTATIGYPTPGSFGNWAGIERSIPTITLELPSHHSFKQCWNDNRDALLSLALALQPQRARTAATS